MKNKKIYLITLLISIWNLILFFGHSLGISVVLFNIPAVALIIYVLYKEKKINNKYGLLFTIPIIVLSISYFLYTSLVTLVFNFIAIIAFYILLIIFTIDQTYIFGRLFDRTMNIVFSPLGEIGRVYNDIFTKNNNKEKKGMSKEAKNIVLSIILIIPIVLIIIILLSSADAIFNNMFKGFFDLIDKFKYIKISDLVTKTIFRGIYLLIFFTYFSAFIYYLSNIANKNKYPEAKKRNSELTIKPLFITLNIIYIIFDFIQIRSLIFHKITMDITYAEYARQGFFQLMFVSLINFVIILLHKKFNKKDIKFNKIMSIIMIVLTSIIVVSSFLRMNMYEQAYGYTVLRLLVYVILITELIIMIPTIIYVIKDKFNITKYYLIILTIIYTIIGVLPLNYIIASRNIDKYYKDNKIDIDYLSNYNYDNLPLLIKLYNNTEDDYIKIVLSKYFVEYYERNSETLENDKKLYFSEYNNSKIRGRKLLKDNYQMFKDNYNNNHEYFLIDSSYISSKEETINKTNYKIIYKMYSYKENGEFLYLDREDFEIYGTNNLYVVDMIKEIESINIKDKLTIKDVNPLDLYCLRDNSLYFYDREKNILHYITKEAL
jgi:hypothetical protein